MHAISLTPDALGTRSGPLCNDTPERLSGTIHGFPWEADYNSTAGDWWLTVDGESLGWAHIPWPLSSAIVDVRQRLEWRLEHPLPDWWDQAPRAPVNKSDDRGGIIP